MGEAAAASGPDFSQGVDLADIPERGPLAGRVGDQPLLLSRIDGDLYAVSGACTHYGAMLANGLADGATIRCPWHHACFDLRTGEALRAPAFAPLDRWQVEIEGGRAFVRRDIGPAVTDVTAVTAARRAPDVRSVLIVGGG